MGAGRLPGRARHLDPSRLCRGVRLRAQQDGKAPGRRRDRDHPAAAAAPRPVGGDDPRPPSRLHPLETYDANIARLAANCTAPAGGAAAPARRRGLAAGPAALRPVRAASCRSTTTPAAGPPTGADARTRCTARRPASGSAGPAARAGAGSCSPRSPPPPGGHRPGHPDTQPSFRQNLAVFERALERARFEAGRCASTTTWSRRTGWSPGPWRPSWKTSSRPCVPPRNQLAAQQARRPVTLTEQETDWITIAGADLRAIFEAPGHHQRPAQGTDPRRHHRGRVTVRTTAAMTPPGHARSSGKAARSTRC